MLTSDLIKKLCRHSDQYGDVPVTLLLEGLEDEEGDPVASRVLLDTKIRTFPGDRCVVLIG